MVHVTDLMKNWKRLLLKLELDLKRTCLLALSYEFCFNKSERTWVQTWIKIYLIFNYKPKSEPDLDMYKLKPEPELKYIKFFFKKYATQFTSEPNLSEQVQQTWAKFGLSTQIWVKHKFSIYKANRTKTKLTPLPPKKKTSFTLFGIDLTWIQP